MDGLFVQNLTVAGLLSRNTIGDQVSTRVCFTKDFETLCTINFKKKKHKNEVRKKHYGLHFTMLKIMNLGPIKFVSVREKQ